MVLVYKTRPEKRELIPAVNHVDDTGRAADASSGTSNPRYYRLIAEFDAADRRPDRAQHVVQRERADRDDARRGVDTFPKTQMDVLVLGNYVVRRSAAATG